MKRSELPLLFPGIVLLLAAAAYALLFFTSRAEDVPSAVCTAALWQDTLSLKGVVSRGETPVSAPEGAVYPLVPDGERVAAGAPVRWTIFWVKTGSVKVPASCRGSRKKSGS